MKVNVRPIVIGRLWTVTDWYSHRLVQEHESECETNCNRQAVDSHRLVQELEDLKIRGRVETVQTTALLRSTRKLRRVPES